MKTIDLTFRTDYGPDACIENLKAEIDPAQRTIFSFSGYRGNKPVLGYVSGRQFRLQKRRYWHNDFAPVLYGNVFPEDSGSHVEAYWGLQRWTRLFMRGWLTLAVLLGAPIFFSSAYQILSGRTAPGDGTYVGLIVPVCMIAFGVIMPRAASALSFSERAFLASFVEKTLVARKTDPPASRSWNSPWE